MQRTPRILLYVLLALLTIGGIIGAVAVFFVPDWLLRPVKSFGPPLRAGDRVYLLTGQWRSSMWHPDDGPTITDLFVDLWAFNAATAVPVWRKRLQTERNGAMDGRSILGAEGDTLWLLVPSGLMAVSLKDGAILADTPRIEAKYPGLKGLLPTDSRYFSFDAKGLHIKAGDGRTISLNPQTFAVNPEEGPNPALRGGIVMPAYYTPFSTSSFVERGLHIPGHWLGVLNDDEAKLFSEKNVVGGIDLETRRRLWHARTGEGTNFFGKFTTHLDFKPLGDRDYLGPGLLAQHASTGPNQVLYYRNPDSVLVLHRDRLGEEGRLRLARIAGPAGNVLWDATLPLSVLQSVMPGEQALVFYGREYTKPKDSRPRDPMHTALEMLIAIDVATGKLSVHNQGDVDNHLDAVAAEVKQ